MPRYLLRGLLVAALIPITGVRAADEAPTASGRFASDTFIAGGSVRVDKPVPGDLIAAGGNVDVDAPVTGSAMLAGGNLRVTAQV
jgi:hypothetical protein